FGAFTCRLVARVVARRDARVRDQQHGRAVRGQHPMGEKKVFFGDFLSPDKKLPAPWSGSSSSIPHAQTPAPPPDHQETHPPPIQIQDPQTTHAIRAMTSPS